MNTRSAFLMLIAVLPGCSREAPSEGSARGAPEPPSAPRPSPPKDPLCSGKLSSVLAWRTERGPADESDEPLPDEARPTALELDVGADGRGTLRVSTPAMSAEAECVGSELRAEFRGEGDGILVLRRKDGRWKGTLRAAPREGRVSLVATVELAPVPR